MDNILSYGQEAFKNPTGLISGNSGHVKKVVFNGF